MTARASLVAVAAAALAVFAAGGPDVNPPRFAAMPREHRFALGEQQVYAVARSATFIIKSRDARGKPIVKSIHADDATSVAFTVESFASDGGAVVGVSAPAPQGSPTPPSVAPVTSPSPKPSPVIRDGGAPYAGDLAILAPLGALFDNLDAPAAVGKKWKAVAAIGLPLGRADLALDNMATYSAGDDSSGTLIVEQRGSARLRGSINVPGLGRVMLAGNATATGSGFLETVARVPLGMDLHIDGGGTCATHSRAPCSFRASARVTIKLVRFVRGETPSPVVVPPFGGASAFFAGTPAASGAPFSTPYPFATATVAAPAPTDTFFIMPYTAPSASPTPLPGISLPPLPLPLPSGQPIATPPAPPGPTPTR